MGGASDSFSIAVRSQVRTIFLATGIECRLVTARQTGPQGADRLDPRAYREALAVRRERLTRAGRALAVALFVLVAAAVLLRLPEAYWVPAAGFLAMAALVLRLTNWRCPACGEPLPTRRGGSCRGCGAALDG